jgi:hypothetical protein
LDATKGSFMNASTSPQKDDASIVLPADAKTDAAKKDEAAKTSPASSDKK